MTCNRCYDIHEAQKNGKTNNECKCCCHNNTVSPTIWYNTTSTTGNPNFTYAVNGTNTYTSTCDLQDKYPCNRVGCMNNADIKHGFCKYCSDE